MLLVYSKNNSSRLNYILKFIFGELLGVKYIITTEKEEYNSFSGAKINYSTDDSLSGLWICSTDLLFSKKIKKQELGIFNSSWGNIIFSTPLNIQIPFDIFSASFYLLSRYEEYLPFNSDEHNRFTPESSIAFKAGFISEPIINIWTKKLFEIIKHKFPDLECQKKKFQFISTIDIDNAFAYKGKGFYRTAGGFSKSVLKGSFNEVKNRILVLNNKLSDHYDTYKFIREIHLKNNIIPKVFVLSGKYGKYDKNVKLSNQLFRNILKELSEFCEIGIHPSYQSSFKQGGMPSCLKEELQNLESVINKKITISRQHFLILNFPATYRRLIESGIKEDYSLGYSNIVGYRAGTCSPFNFYDLLLEKETELKIFPFAFMERTLRQHLKLTPIEAEKIISENIKEIKELNGLFVSLWHNESLGDVDYWQGWKLVYEQIFNLTK